MSTSNLIALVGKPGDETGRLVIRFTDGDISMEGEANAAEMALASVVLARLAVNAAIKEDGQ